MMQERNGIITMKGNPLTLLGPELKPGQTAPEATLVANDLSEVKLSALKGKKRIFSVVPSLDTGVCDIQTKKFNEEAGKLGSDVKILTISMDLPFAQKRWCGAASVTNLTTFSDHRDASFGAAYGLLIKGLRLLARAVIVVDVNDKIKHVQIVKEVTTEPDYQAALEALKS